MPAPQPVFTNTKAAPSEPLPPASKNVDRPMGDTLSQRELEVLQLIVDGLLNQEIADKLMISFSTSKTHVRNILNKLAVDDRTQAAVHAMCRGLI
jgi:DNA-binding NarL/FixJ family response regulator